MHFITITYNIVIVIRRLKRCDNMTTMGLEVEIPHITRRTAQLVDWCRCEVHDDGSIRHDNYSIDGLSIVPLKSKRFGAVYPSGAAAADHFGVEIVTSPYEYEEMRRHAERFAKFFGHLPTTPRASIHVHVDVIDKPWTYVRNLCHWFIALEAPLYRLSALGEEHRGQQMYNGAPQDHLYARPLTNSIGIRPSPRRVHRPLVDYEALITAKTASEFVRAWGRLDKYWGTLPRYCPHRQHGLNIVPLQTLHTVEWRLFNGRYRYMPQVIDIVHAMHRLAERGAPTFEPMPLGTQPDISGKEIQAILGLDNLLPIWGRDRDKWRWVRGCDVHAMPSHYEGGRYDILYAPTDEDTNIIWNNNGQDDNSSEGFCFGVSTAPRGVRGRRRRPEPEEYEIDNDSEEED